ncbi:pentapeptide repeat-containing protein [Dactylosporangium sp. NPDC049742]|uniref:pentapeptide repeat-containing protein n=1 Tax=Dactylosporangium sp. NPDC049742 TaxID=3154737 RepID=UPI003431C17A
MNDSDAADPLERANDRIRDASKWLVASAAAVGAALIAGSQLSDIGRLPVGAPTSVEHARLWVAVLGAVLGLVAVVHVIWRAVQILLPALVTIEELDAAWAAPPRDLRPVVAFFRARPKYLQGFSTPGELIEHRAERADALAGTAERSGGVGEEEEIRGEITDLDQRITTIEMMAAHERLKSQFHGALSRLLVSAAVAALGVTAFAWAANPPDREAGADLRNARLVGAFLRDGDLRNAKLDHADLTGADLTGADLTGASVVGTIWRDTTCPDGRNSDEVGGTCAGHLS